MSSNLDTSNLDTSNLDISSITVDTQQKCCIMNENINLRNTILLQCQEIGNLITERNEYKHLYESLLIEIGSNINTSNI